MNKPGMIIVGSQGTYDNEEDGGYAPHKITWEQVPTFVAQGWDIWVDVGTGQYTRMKNPKPCGY
jgi:hypothetical protein